MFRSPEGFRATWRHESANTAKVLANITDASLDRRAAAGHRSLGELAWHIVVAPRVILGKVGLTVAGPEKSDPVPVRAAIIHSVYVEMAKAVAGAVEGQWDREALAEVVDFYGTSVPRGEALEVALRHEIHHRGQLTVLMRLAGLRVPGVYGPSGDD